MELWFTERHTPYVNFSIKVERQLYTAQSEFQRIDVFESREFGRFLTLDGYMMLTEKDEFIYHEMITHIPMAVHPNPENILVIGAGDGGVVRELTRYQSPKCIDLVEIDELVIEVCRKYLPKTACRLDDPRVHIHIADGLKFNEGAHLEASSRATAAGATGGHSSAASGHTASHIAAGHTAHHHIRAGGCCPQIGNGVPLL